MTPIVLVVRAFVLVASACVVLLLLMGKPAMPFDFTVTQELRDLLSMLASVIAALLIITVLVVGTSASLRGN